MRSILVLDVTPNSNAEILDLKKGDVIVKFNNTYVQDTHEIINLINQKKEFTLKVFSNGVYKDIPFPGGNIGATLKSVYSDDFGVHKSILELEEYREENEKESLDNKIHDNSIANNPSNLLIPILDAIFFIGPLIAILSLPYTQWGWLGLLASIAAPFVTHLIALIEAESIFHWASIVTAFLWIISRFFLIHPEIPHFIQYIRGPVFVRGYYRRDGTYVRSHYRSR